MRSGDRIAWAELVLFVGGEAAPVEDTPGENIPVEDAAHMNAANVEGPAVDVDNIHRYARRFESVRVAGTGGRPEGLAPEIRWHSCRPGEPRSEVYNRLLDVAGRAWVLFLEEDEELDFGTFPQAEQISPHRWAPVCIHTRKGKHPRQYYQMRLVPAGKGPIFDGHELADCTRFIHTHEVDIADAPIRVFRNSSLTSQVDVEEELSIRDYSPQLYLVQGERYFQEGKYVHAAAQYRQLLKETQLLPFDRLAAVNGLTSCLAEQHKWEQTMALAQTSIEAEPLQRMPYLIRFKIYQLRKQWGEALEELDTYYGLLEHTSRASFDKAIPKEEALVQLTELALKANNREQAADYKEQLYRLKEGNVERSFLKEALVLAIERSDYERSVFFFKRLFQKKLPDQLGEEEKEELNYFMNMIMNNGWYEYASEIYTTLFDRHPQDKLYKRRLIVALTKTQRMDEARALI